MKIKFWQISVLGLTVAIGGLLSIRFSVGPYAPAIASGFPDAKAVVSNGPFPFLAIISGLLIVIGSLVFAAIKKKLPFQSTTDNSGAAPRRV